MNKKNTNKNKNKEHCNNFIRHLGLVFNSFK